MAWSSVAPAATRTNVFVGKAAARVRAAVFATSSRMRAFSAAARASFPQAKGPWPPTRAAGTAEGERPAAYIVVLGDTRITRSFGCDHGIAAQTILLGAVEKGLRGCMLASVDREGLRQALGIPRHFEILLVVALGRPKERVVLEDMGPLGDYCYWRDSEGVHHVPKRRLEDVIVGVR